MIVKGKVWKFGDNIDTDAIIPARYLTTSDPQELAAHCMEDADPKFVTRMKAGILFWEEKTSAAVPHASTRPLPSKRRAFPAWWPKVSPAFFIATPLTWGCPFLNPGNYLRQSKKGKK